MAKGQNQKLKLLYLSKIMRQETDDEHGLTMPEIIEKLAQYDIDAARKSIYDDLESLDAFGIEILKEKRGNKTYYHCGARDFEVPELKLLVDAIQSSKFITPNKSKELIKKLEANLSIYDAKLLQREVFVTDRVKNMNESIYLTVDTIQSAMTQDQQLTFQYVKWTPEARLEPKRNGDFYQVSPWALVYDNENYYLVAYDQDSKDIRHYRVDKIKKAIVIKEKRLGSKEFSRRDKSKYNEKRFNMYDGPMTTLELRCHNDMANVIFDQFGGNIHNRKLDEEHFLAIITIAVSKQFYGWLAGLGNQVQIMNPKEEAIKFQDYIKEIHEGYNY